MALRRHIPLIFLVLLLGYQGCNAQPLATEILHFGSHFALLLVFLGGVNAIPQHSSSPTLTGMRSYNASSTHSFNATASVSHTVFSNSATNHTSNIITNVTEKSLSTTATHLQPSTSDLLETDLPDKVDDILAEVTKITGPPPTTIYHLASIVPSSVAQSTSTQNSFHSFRVGNFSLNDKPRHPLHKDEHGNINSTQNQCQDTNAADLHPSQDHSSDLAPKFTLNPLSNGHISIVASAPHKHEIYRRDNAPGIPLYKLWREPLMEFSRELARASSNTSDYGVDGVHHTAEEELLDASDGILSRRTWYQKHKNNTDTCLPPWNGNPLASEFNFTSPFWGAGKLSATFNYTSPLSGSCNGPPSTGISSLFRPFHALDREIDNEPDVSDEDYFDYTQENIDKSNVIAWYFGYVLLRGSEMRRNGSRGEWGTFVADFYGDPTFRCDLSYTHCPLYDELPKVRSQYPGLEDRTIARRLLFIGIMQSEIHQLLYSVMNTDLNIIFRTMQGYIEKLIMDFTQQKDQKAARNCRLLHDLINFIIQMAIETGVGMAGAFVPPLFAGKNILSQLSTVNLLSWKTNDYTKLSVEWNSKWTTEAIPSSPFGADGRYDEEMSKYHTNAPPQYNFFTPLINYISALPMAEYNKHKGGSGKFFNKDSRKDNRIGMGIDTDPFCGRSEGGQTDRNKENQDKLRASLPENFRNMTDEISSFFGRVEGGVFIGEYAPSLWSLIMMQTKWVGPGSVREKLKNGNSRRDHFEKMLMKHIIGKILGENHNYIKCFHFADLALAEAHRNVIAEPWDEKWDKRTQHWHRSIFFPRNETEPELMCQVAHWYPAVSGGSHENAFVALDTLEKFEPEKYHFNLTNMLPEAFNYYKIYGNEVNKVDWMSWGLGSNDMPSFHLPVCVNDHLGSYDLNEVWDSGAKNPKGIRWPFMCGDYAGNETSQFREAVNADETSELYQSFKDLFSNIIARLAHEAALTPVAHYSVLCRNGIRIPGKKDGKKDHSDRIQKGRDEECQKILSGIKDTKEEEANKWFCSNDKHFHTVFDREVRKYNLDHHPWMGYRPGSHKSRCNDWQKAQTGKKKKLWEEAENLAEKMAQTQKLGKLEQAVKKMQELCEAGDTECPL